MTEIVYIKENSELIGVNNIVVSNVNNKIFITNTINIEPGTKNSLAIYNIDNDNELSSIGKSCVWDHKKNRLEIINVYSDVIDTRLINSKIIKTEFVDADHQDVKTIIVNDYFHSPKISIGNWLAFKSKKYEEHHCFRLQLKTDKAGNEVLTLTSFPNKDIPETPIIKINDNRISFLGIVNLKDNTILSSLGTNGDKKGDISIDDNYLYFCVKDYNGKSKIWKRTELSYW